MSDMQPPLELGPDTVPPEHRNRSQREQTHRHADYRRIRHPQTACKKEDAWHNAENGVDAEINHLVFRLPIEHPGQHRQRSHGGHTKDGKHIIDAPAIPSGSEIPNHTDDGEQSYLIQHSFRNILPFTDCQRQACLLYTSRCV